MPLSTLVRANEPTEVGNMLAAFGGENHIPPERAALNTEEIEWLLEKSVWGGKGRSPSPHPRDQDS